MDRGDNLGFLSDHDRRVARILPFCARSHSASPDKFAIGNHVRNSKVLPAAGQSLDTDVHTIVDPWSWWTNGIKVAQPVMMSFP